MYADPAIDRRLPPESEMDRRDVLEAFVAVLNTVRPEHPHHQDIWPLRPEDIQFGVTRSHFARCGPRRSRVEPVSYNTRLTHINGISREKHLALLVHEISHIPLPNQRGQSAHSRAFWHDVAFHALELRDALHDGVLDGIFGDVDVDKYIQHVVEDPNKKIIDGRQWTVDECRSELASLLGVQYTP